MGTIGIILAPRQLTESALAHSVNTLSYFTRTGTFLDIWSITSTSLCVSSCAFKTGPQGFSSQQPIHFFPPHWFLDWNILPALTSGSPSLPLQSCVLSCRLPLLCRRGCRARSAAPAFLRLLINSKQKKVIFFIVKNKRITSEGCVCFFCWKGWCVCFIAFYPLRWEHCPCSVVRQQIEGSLILPS